MWQKVIQTGNSKAVTIPAEFIRSVGIKVGDRVKSETRLDSGRVIYTFFGVRQMSLTGNLQTKKP